MREYVVMFSGNGLTLCFPIVAMMRHWITERLLTCRRDCRAPGLPRFLSVSMRPLGCHSTKKHLMLGQENR